VLSLLNNSGLSGTLPNTLFDMKNMVELEIGDVPLEGTVPNLWSELPTLERLSLFGMEKLTIEFPTGVNLNFKQIRFHRNQNIGSIPTSVGELTRLDDLWLFDSNMVGTLPEELNDLALMKHFRVGNNQLSGTLPNYNWRELEQLELFENNLEGTLPDLLKNAFNMKIIIIHGNRFNGTVDPDIGTNLASLESFIADRNQFTGPIPATFANAEKLTAFQVSQNDFSGTFPFDICSLRAEGGLEFVFADCLGYPPKNFCRCCTSCCDPVSESCQGAPNEDIRFLRGKEREEQVGAKADTREPHFFGDYFSDKLKRLSLTI